MKGKKIIGLVKLILPIIVLLWVAASFIDVNSHNLSDGRYAKWNLFARNETAVAAPRKYVAEPLVATEETMDLEAELLTNSIEEYQQEHEEQVVVARTREERIQQVKEMTEISDEYVDMCFEYAEPRHICPQLVVALIEKESKGNPNARGSSGEIGLTQIIPRFHKAEIQELGVTDLTDPRQNIETCCEILLNLFEEHEEVYDVLMFYNAGYGGLDKAQNCDFSEYSEWIVSRTYELGG